MFNLKAFKSNAFADLNDYVSAIQHTISATAAAIYIIHNDRMVNEWYSGFHDISDNSRLVDEESQFNVASVRKTYLGFGISLAIYEGKIKSIDDLVIEYLDDLDKEILGNTTIRHLLTHTHGLASLSERLFIQGSDWKYNNIGVNLLIKILQKLYKMSLSELLTERVFVPCGFTNTGWRKEKTEKLVWLDKQYGEAQGNEANLFVSAKELAFWGYLHLNKGSLNGKQIIPETIIEQATRIISPSNLMQKLPRNGFFWFIQDEPRLMTELGDRVPKGSFQSLGITGCACLVIPKHRTVAVRMFNQVKPNPIGYDYLSDIKTFGNMVCKCVEDIESWQALQTATKDD